MTQGSTYKKPMKNFLNQFMKSHKRCDKSLLDEYRCTFENTANLILDKLGEKPFHIRRAGLNAAVFDCVFSAVAQNLDSVPDDFSERYSSLIVRSEFLECATSGTTDQDIVARRMSLAIEAFGWTDRV